MKLKLVFLEQSDFKPKDSDKTYKIYHFLDLNSLQVLTGTDLNGTFEKWKVYDVNVDYIKGKIKVVNI